MKSTFDEHKHKTTDERHLKCEECGKIFSKTEDFQDHVLKVHTGRPSDKNGTISQENLFMNVLAYQVDNLMTNLQVALAELEAIKCEQKNNKCKCEGHSNEVTTRNEDDKIEKLIETIDKKIDKLDNDLKTSESNKNNNVKANQQEMNVKENNIVLICEECD